MSENFKKALLITIFTLLCIGGIILSNIFMGIPNALIPTIAISMIYIITTCYLGDI